jgi:hypothetical protein
MMRKLLSLSLLLVVLAAGIPLALNVFSYRCWRADCLPKFLKQQEKPL